MGGAQEPDRLVGEVRLRLGVLARARGTGRLAGVHHRGDCGESSVAGVAFRVSNELAIPFTVGLAS